MWSVGDVCGSVRLCLALCGSLWFSPGVGPSILGYQRFTSCSAVKGWQGLTRDADGWAFGCLHIWGLYKVQRGIGKFIQTFRNQDHGQNLSN